jgi:ubiquitin-conjugating enzyme E2 J2
MPTQTCLARLKKEYQILTKNPIQSMKIYISPSNILKWYFSVYNLNQIDYPWYQGGEYYGYIEMHHDYPYKPPSYYMLTPSGRFAVGQSICTTNSAFHGSLWNPLWTLDGLFRGFLSLFLDDNSNQQLAVNHLHTSTATKAEYAKRSKDYNLIHNSEIDHIMSNFEEIIFHSIDKEQIQLQNQVETTQEVSTIQKPKIKLKLKPKPPSS